MSPKNPVVDQTVSDQQVAEAAAWMAHLHGSRRTPDSDKGHQLWLQEDAARRKAWEAATEVWEETGLLQGVALEKGIRAILPEAPKKEHPMRQRLAVAAGVALLAAGAGMLFWARSNGIYTGVGEQRVVALDDGSRVVLNTASRIVVSYSGRLRKIELKSGEARFDVAKQNDRPFVVIAGDRRIDALGTAFVVRHDPGRTAITLVEGRVKVGPIGPGTVASARSSHESPASEPGVVMLHPGQRLTFDSGAPPRVDNPELAKLIAWQRGEIVMDGMKLRDAVVEMNRYSARKLEVASESAGDLVVSGVFQSGDSLSFARAVAHTYQLLATEEGNRILLAGNPKAAYH